MNIIVCGGRGYADVARMSNVLGRVMAEHPGATIVTGAARGADTLATLWAGANGVECELFPADWERDGKAAGPIRNARMLKESAPVLVVAFPGGRGTAHMVSIARKAGVPVEVVE